jgi:hypothetical protein
MSELDPYAPPATSGVALSRPRWFRREGKFVVVRTGAVLPARCVKTNEQVEEYNAAKPRQLMWVPLWARLSPSLGGLLLLLAVWRTPNRASVTFLGGAVLTIVVAGFLSLIVQKRLNVTYALNRRQRRWRLAVQSVAAGCGIGAWFLFEANGTDSMGFFVLIGGFLLVGALQHPLRITRHRDGEFWLKGASPAFLDSLEET